MAILNIKFRRSSKISEIDEKGEFNDKAEQDELNTESDEEFDVQFNETEEVTDEELDKEFDEQFNEMEEVTDEELDKEFDEQFNEMEEVTDEELDKEFDEQFNEMEEVTDEELDKEFDEQFNEMEEVTDEELDKEFDEQFDEMEEEYENIGSQSTVLMHENPEIEGENQEELQAESEEYTEEEEEHLENEEEVVEIDPEEYENDQDPIIDTEEIEFVRDMEELGRMLKEYDEKLGYSEEENDNTAFNAEQAYREIKERNSNKEEKEEGQELEEHEKEITEEQKEEKIEENLSGDAQEEDVNDIPEEAEIEPEEFDYLWEKYEQYEQEGKSSEEIRNLMQEAEETYNLLKSVEKLYEQQEKEKLKSIDHEDEEDDEDVREEIDRVDAIEYFVDFEEKLHQQGKSQEEIDDQVEEIAKDLFLSEIEEKEQNEQERDVSEELRIEQAEFDEENLDLEEQEQIRQISVYDNNEVIETCHEMERKEAEEVFYTELDDIEVEEVPSYQEKSKESMEKEEKLESKVAEEEEYEKLQQLYRQETGKRPIYAGRETKGFSQWLEQHELKTKELEEKEEKEREEEWQRTLKDWIEGSIEEDLSSELKVILKEIIQNFRNYEDLEELYKRYEKGELTKKVRDEFNSIINKLRSIDPIHLHLYLNISGFKAYFQDRHWWNPALVSEIKYKFLRHLSKKYEILKKKDIQYFSPELRKKISKENLNLIWRELSKMGIKLKEIDERIGLTFKSLRMTGHSISNEVYDNLNSFIKTKLSSKKVFDLFGQNNIPYQITIGKSGKMIKILEDNEMLDEFLAIMLGDGSLLSNGKSFSIALNREDEEKYVEYVKVLMKKLLPKSLIHEIETEGKGIVLIINDMSYHYALVTKGLIPGDKVKHQVCVPLEVIENRRNLHRWLKGLFDTDGTIYIRTNGMSISLAFSSASKPLINDFKTMCELLEIKTLDGIAEGKYQSELTGEYSTVYMIFIDDKKSVRKFIQIVDPQKFKEPSRRLYLGLKLILRKSPKKISQDVRNKLDKIVPNKKDRRYSKKFALLLKKTIESSFINIIGVKNFNITEDMIERAINNAIRDKSLTHYIKIENNKIRLFPSNLRNYICARICRIIESNIDLNRKEVFNLLFSHVNRSSVKHFHELYILLNDEIIGKYLRNYIYKLVDIVREINKQSHLGDLHLYTISKDFNINHKITISIAKYLKNNMHIQYPNAIVQKQPEITTKDLYLQNKLNIDKYVINLRDNGLTYRNISKKATKKYGFKITYWRVSKILDYEKLT